MIAVTLADCTPYSGLLAHAITDAATDVMHRSHRLAWGSRPEVFLAASPETWRRVIACEELHAYDPLGSGTIPRRIFGLPVETDLDVPPNVIRAQTDSGVFTPIEVR